MNTKSKEVSIESFNMPSGKLVSHTPTPWSIEQSVSDCQEYILSENGQTIAAISEDGLYKHDAAFIVKAVNSHEALLEVLEEIKKIAYAQIDAHPGAKTCAPEIIALADRAISKVK